MPSSVVALRTPKRAPRVALFAVIAAVTAIALIVLSFVVGVPAGNAAGTNGEKWTLTTDGSTPFDATSGPGLDTGANNKVLRAQDTGLWNFSFTATAAGPATVRVTIPSGAEWPATASSNVGCTNGVTIVSRTQLDCRVAFADGDIVSINFAVTVGAMANGAVLSPSASIGGGAAITADAANSVTVSATPYTMLRTYNSNTEVATVGGIKGARTWHSINLITPVPTDNPKLFGREALSNVVTFDVTLVAGASVSNSSSQLGGGTVSAAPKAGATDNTWTITLTGATTSWISPTALAGSPTFGGLPAVASVSIALGIFYPYDTVVPPNATTQFSAQVKNYAPVSLSGQPNPAVPGQESTKTCPTPVAQQSDACLGGSITRRTSAELNETNIDSAQPNAAYTGRLFGGFNSKVLVGEQFTAMGGMFNSGSSEQAANDPWITMVWDPSELSLVTARAPRIVATGALASSFYAAGHGSPIPSADYVMEFSDVALASASARSSFDASTDTAAVWYSDPSLVPGGAAAVSVIRVKYLKPLNPGSAIGLAPVLKRTVASENLAIDTALRWYNRGGASGIATTAVKIGSVGVNRAFVRASLQWLAVPGATYPAGSAQTNDVVSLKVSPTVYGPVEGSDAVATNSRIQITMPSACYEPVSVPDGATLTPGVPGADCNTGTPAVVTWGPSDIAAPVGAASPDVHGVQLTPFEIPVLVKSGVTPIPTTAQAKSVASSSSDTTVVGERSASATLSVSAASVIKFTKTATSVVPGKVAQGEEFTYTLTWTNPSIGSFTNTTAIDVLPFEGDVRGSTGLTLPLEVLNVSASMTTVEAGSVTVEWTRTAAATVESIVRSTGGTAGNSPQIVWNSGPVAADATALRFSIPQAMVPGSSGSATITLQSPGFTSGGNLANDLQIQTTDSNSGTVIGSARTALLSLTSSTAALSLVKTVLPTQVSAPGEEFTYSYTVVNTGSVAVTDPQIDETEFSGTGEEPTPSCPSGTLQPGASVVCTATYVATQEDVDQGEIRNTAVATATPRVGVPPRSAPATAIVTADTVRSVSLIKLANPVTVTAADETVQYTFFVTNTGNVTLTDFTVDELEFTGAGSSIAGVVCPEESLEPGENMTCSADPYVVVQDDIERGSITNKARIVAADTQGVVVSSDESEAEVAVDQRASLSLTKTVSPDTVVFAGEQVNYSFVVTNTGNLSLTSPTITETKFTGTGAAPSITCPDTVILPGESVECVAPYVVTAADVEAGSVTNEAVASARTVTSDSEFVSEPSSATFVVTSTPDVDLTKTVTPTTFAVSGQTLEYTFDVHNTGNTRLTGVEIDEREFSGSAELGAPVCPSDVLAAGEQMQCTLEYTVTDEDVAAGRVVNTAVVQALSGEDAVESDQSTAEATVADGAVTLEKTVAPNKFSVVGQVLQYTFAISNTGETRLGGVGVDERDFTGSGELEEPVCPADELAAGERMVCTLAYTVTDEDVAAGRVVNSAVAQATSGSGLVESAESSAEAILVDKALTLIKTVSPGSFSAAGDDLLYSFQITNNSEVTISDLLVEELEFTGTGDLSAVDCPTTELAAGESTVCTARYEVTSADVTAGRVTNTAQVTGESSEGQRITSDDSTAWAAQEARGLAFTGFSVGVWVAPAAGVLVLMGLAFVVTARRRRRSA
jgi:hypothetical protein